MVDMSIANSQDTLQTSHFIVLLERTRRAGPLRFHVQDEGLAIPQPRTPGARLWPHPAVFGGMEARHCLLTYADGRWLPPPLFGLIEIPFGA
jgi:hypothetical protein